MQQSKQLTKRFRETFLDGKWITNTNYKELLSTITWKEATTKVGTLNTIAALTFHVNYYVAGVLDYFQTGQLTIRDKYSFDCPPIQSEEDWAKLCNELSANSEKFATYIEQLSEEQLQTIFVHEKYGNYHRNIDGMIEHGFYHLGQIVIIKKMLS